MKREYLNKVSKTPVSKLKKKLWAITREIAFIKYGSDCYTCTTKNLSGSNRHLGHFIPSSVCSASMRYDFNNLKPQCYACNVFRSGNWPAYEEHLKRDGIDSEALKQRNRDTQGMKADSLYYLRLIEEREAELAKLSTPIL